MPVAERCKQASILAPSNTPIEKCSTKSRLQMTAGTRRGDLPSVDHAHFSGLWTRSDANCSIMSEAIQLYDTEGRRLYLTSAERDIFLDAATQADRPVRTLWAFR